MITIVASHELWPTPAVAGELAAIMAFAETTGQGIGVRASRKDRTIASHVEEAAVKLAGIWGVEAYLCIPDGNGRESVFRRDYELVENSTKVFAYFAPGEEMEGGTGHVVKAALDRGVDVEAYKLDDQGEIVLLGSHEETT